MEEKVKNLTEREKLCLLHLLSLILWQLEHSDSNDVKINRFDSTDYSPTLYGDYYSTNYKERVFKSIDVTNSKLEELIGLKRYRSATSSSSFDEYRNVNKLDLLELKGQIEKSRYDQRETEYYSLTYDNNGKLVLNKTFTVVATQAESDTDKLLRHMFSNPNDVSNIPGVPNYKITKILDNIGLKTWWRDIFFKRVNGKLTFRADVTIGQITDENLWILNIDDAKEFKDITPI